MTYNIFIYYITILLKQISFLYFIIQILFKYTFSYHTVPGQCLTVHFSEEVCFIPPFPSVYDWKVELKVQLDPPYWGKGSSHILILDLVPSPQVSEHGLQFLQAPQRPSTSYVKCRMVSIP